MLRIFKVKRAVKNVNPLTDDPQNTYYEEVNMGGLMPNERALKVCYQNGDIWKLKDFTTKTEQVEIQKVLNSTLYEFNGFFIIKNKNDTASREYYCFITVDKQNEVLEDKHWLIWLTVYYDLNGSTGFKILLRWDLQNFIFTIVKDPVQINLLEGDDFNAEKNHYSLPTVAVVRKWYYHKEWLDIPTPNPDVFSGDYTIFGETKKIPMETFDINMPSEDVMRGLIRDKISKTDKEYDLLSMDFSLQNNKIPALTTRFDNVLTVDYIDYQFTWFRMYNLDLNVTNASIYDLKGVGFKILDKKGNIIKHPLVVSNDIDIEERSYDIINHNGTNYILKENNNDIIKFSRNGTTIWAAYNLTAANYRVRPNIYVKYPPYRLIPPIKKTSSQLSNPNPEGEPNSDYARFAIRSYDYQYIDKVTSLKLSFIQTCISEAKTKAIDESLYMPLWGKVQFYFIPETYFLESEIVDNEGNHLGIFDGCECYYALGKYIPLKYLVGYWKQRS